MTVSNAARAGQFKKGDDPRRHRGGQTSAKVLAFNRSLRELLVTEGERQQTDAEGKVTLKKVEWLTKVVWNAALKGEHWAVEFIAERTEGKVTQPVSGDISHTLRFVFGDNGNGNGNGEAHG